MEVIEGVQDNYILGKNIETHLRRSQQPHLGRVVGTQVEPFTLEMRSLESTRPARLIGNVRENRGVKCSIHLSFPLGLGLKKLRGCRLRSMKLVGRGLLDLPIR